MRDRYGRRKVKVPMVQAEKRGTLGVRQCDPVVADFDVDDISDAICRAGCAAGMGSDEDSAGRWHYHRGCSV